MTRLLVAWLVLSPFAARVFGARLKSLALQGCEHGGEVPSFSWVECLPAASSVPASAAGSYGTAPLAGAGTD